MHATISVMTLGELAERLGAELVAGEGGDAAAAAKLPVTGVAGIETASATEVTFVANPKYAGLARKSTAAAVIVEPGFGAVAAPTLRIKNPYLAFARAVEIFHPPPKYAPGIHPTAVIAESAEARCAGACGSVCGHR